MAPPNSESAAATAPGPRRFAWAWRASTVAMHSFVASQLEQVGEGLDTPTHGLCQRRGDTWPRHCPLVGHDTAPVDGPEFAGEGQTGGDSCVCHEPAEGAEDVGREPAPRPTRHQTDCCSPAELGGELAEHGDIRARVPIRQHAVNIEDESTSIGRETVAHLASIDHGRSSQSAQLTVQGACAW